MKLEECFERIDKYMASSDKYPRFINVNNTNDMNAVSSHFKVGGTLFVKSEDFAKRDNCISEAKLLNFLEKVTQNIFFNWNDRFLQVAGARETKADSK